MPHNLKLEIFRITLKKRGGSDDDLLPFSDFFKKEFDAGDKRKAYNGFVSKFISYFRNEFRLNADGTKGIAAKDGGQFTARSNQNVIDGEVNGGNTGIRFTVYNKKNSTKAKGPISEQDVSALPYFIKIWTPYDHNTGVLMVQSYSNNTVTALVKIHLQKLFQEYGYSLICTSYIPNEVKRAFESDSKVYKMAIVKENLARDKRELLNPMFTKFENLRVRIEVSGFKEDVKEFWSQIIGKGKAIQTNLEDLDIKEREDYEIVAYYKDSEGHESSTTIKKNHDISPTIFLNDSLKQDGSEYYNFDKIRTHTDELLLGIKEEIHYLE